MIVLLDESLRHGRLHRRDYTPGIVGLLVPNKVLSAEYAETLRRTIVGVGRIGAVYDFSTMQVFAASVYPVALIIHNARSESQATIYRSDGSVARVPQSAFQEAPGLLWGHVLSDYADVLALALHSTVPLGSLATLSGAATVAEAYEIAKSVRSLADGLVPDGHKRFIVSGNIRSGYSTWECAPVQYLKHRYERPIVPLDALSPRRQHQATSPKIILSGMAKRPTAFFDQCGAYVAGKSTVLVLEPSPGISLKTLEVILNSRVMALVYRAFFGGLSLAGGYLRFGPPQLGLLPIPKGVVGFKLEAENPEGAVCDLYGVSEADVNEAFVRILGDGNRAADEVQGDE